MDDEIDNLLRRLGRAGARDGASSTPGETCLGEADLEAFRAGRLEPDVRESVEAHLAGCARCTRLLSLQLHEDRPLDAVRREAVVSAAMRELEPARRADRTTPERTGGAWLRELWISLWRHPAPLAAGLALAVALLVLLPRLSDGPEGAGAGGIPELRLELGGQQQVFQGSEASESGAAPVFGPDAAFRAVLSPVGTELLPAGLEVLVLVRRPTGRLVTVAPDGPARVRLGEGGILVQGDGVALFGEEPGPAEVWFVVARGEALEAVGPWPPEPDKARARLEQGAAGGHWRFSVLKVDYRRRFGP